MLLTPPFRSRSWLGLLLTLAALVPVRGLDAPATPNAHPRVGALMQFLHDITGQYILSGQQEQVDWFGKNNEPEFNYIFEKTGRYPAVRSFDFMFYSISNAEGRRGQRVAERAIDWAHRGGLVHISYHWNAGAPRESFYAKDSDFDLQRALTPGHRDHDEFIAEMDVAASELKLLRDAGVPVIWRPFHEVNGNAGPNNGNGAWFWWGAKGPEVFKQAWKLMFERFTQHHGLTNLIWCYNPTAVTGALEAWYPGDAYVDMISLDIYPTSGHPTFAAEYRRFREFKGDRKLYAISENGRIPDPDGLFNEGAHWTFFSTWDRDFIMDGTTNPVSFLQNVFNHEKVITLDELPALFPTPPSILIQPASASSVPLGATVVFSVTAAGPGELTYQWLHNGHPIPDATGPELRRVAVDAGMQGTYLADVTNLSGGTVTTAPATLSVSTQHYQPPVNRLINLSTRGYVANDADMMIAGFVISGPGAKKVLIRAVGPGLDQWLSGALTDSAFRVFDSQGKRILYADDWTRDGDLETLAAASARAGAFELAHGSRDAVAVVSLPPGAYTVTVRSPVSGTGTALVEVYDLDLGSAARLVNLSTRGRVRSDNPMIAGFVLQGSGERSLLIRAIGPQLVGFGLSTALVDPYFELHGNSGAIASNDDWQDIAHVFQRRGAFALTEGSKDAALVRSISPGHYTTVVKGHGPNSGIALVEVYED
jgi:hypothetical protein